MKKIVMILLLSFAMVIPAFANLYAVNPDNLPKDEDFNQRLEQFLDNYDLSSDYYPEWKFDKSKEDVTSELLAFDEYLSGLKKPSYDTKLIRLITMRCLYNLDAYDSDVIKDYADSLKKKHKKELRTWWIYGKFLSQTYLLSESYEELTTALNMFGGLDKADYYFLHDYTYTCYISRNIKHGWLALQTIAERDNIPVEDTYLYGLYNGIVETADINETYSANKVWKAATVGENEYRLFSTMLGVSIPLSGAWGLQINDYQNQLSSVLFKPERFETKNKEPIGISVLVLSTTKENGYDFLKSVSISRYKDAPKNYKKVINGVEWEIFEGEDLTAYNDIRGGHRGLYAIVTIPYSKLSGLNLEMSASYDFSEGTDQLGYYRVQPAFDRVETDVSFLVMMDTCNVIYKESSAWFWNYMNQIIVE